MNCVHCSAAIEPHCEPACFATSDGETLCTANPTHPDHEPASGLTLHWCTPETCREPQCQNYQRCTCPKHAVHSELAIKYRRPPGETCPDPTCLNNDTIPDDFS